MKWGTVLDFQDFHTVSLVITGLIFSGSVPRQFPSDQLHSNFIYKKRNWGGGEAHVLLALLNHILLETYLVAEYNIVCS